ncbi:hypothetical protein ACXAT6_003905 [Clostridium sporogenes]
MEKTKFKIAFMNNIEREFVVDDEQIFKDIIKWFKDENDTSIFEIHQIKSNNQKYDFYISKKSIAYIADLQRI